MNICRVFLSIALIAISLVNAFAAEETPESSAALEYLGRRATGMADRLPKLPEKPAAWQTRRRQVRAELADVLGLPKRVPMRAAVVGQRQDGDLTIDEVIYLWQGRAYATANVIRLTNVQGRLPAIVSPPGWLGQFHLPYYKDWIYHMARKGYLVMFIDDPHVGKRKAGHSGLYGIASAAGTQVMGIQVFDALRALDYLLTRQDVDPGRIGISGLCQGSEQTWLVAALDDRFKVVSPVCGTTTYQWWARMPHFLGVSLSDPSPYVEGILRHTEWDEINACIAPRPLLIASNSGDNWWPKPGFDKVVATLRRTYAMYNAPDHFDVVWDQRSHSMTPFTTEIDAWFEKFLRPLPRCAAEPLPCREPVDPDTSMIRYFQRRIAKQAATFPQEFDSPDDWAAYRGKIARWLRAACAADELIHGKPTVRLRRERDGLIVETVYLPQDEGFACPAVAYRKTARAEDLLPAVILSHDSSGCTADVSVVKTATTLAADGFLVIVPDHASTAAGSLRRIGSQQKGANLISLYGVGDTVGLPPLAMRVWDDLSCIEYLAERSDVDKGRIVAVGMGIGGIDVALSAVLDGRIAGAALVGATTVQDWAAEVAPAMHLFDRLMPYLPSIATKTDLQYYYAAVAPRPLLLVDTTDRQHWPAGGFKRAKETAAAVYGMLDAEKNLTAVAQESSWGLDEVRSWLRTRFLQTDRPATAAPRLQGEPSCPK